jgi:16S rRNA (guanine966-N2)-methyltransferase
VTRIIAGVARGRRLAVPPGEGTRPTSDRAREGLFSTLTALRGGLHGARLLDLYAGSGAIGLEALSRGADRALLVESDPAAARVIRANVNSVGLPGARLVGGPVSRVLAAGPGAEDRFDVAVADPPYALDNEEVARVLAVLLTSRWLVPGAIVAVERSKRYEPFSWPAGYGADRSRRYGEATFWYGLAAGT